MYENIESLKQDLERLSIFLKKKQYEALFPYIQNKDEKMILGLIGHGPYDAINECWFIMSNFHVFIVSKASIMQPVTVIKIPLNKIDFATEARGILLSRIVLSVKGEIYTLHDTSKSGSARFIGYFTNRKEELSNAQKNYQEDYISQIEYLFELKEKGILTDEEYAQEKNKILSNRK